MPLGTQLLSGIQTSLSPSLTLILPPFGSKILPSLIVSQQNSPLLFRLFPPHSSHQSSPPANPTFSISPFPLWGHLGQVGGMSHPRVGERGFKSINGQKL